MKKIPTIFERNPDNRALVLNKINPACQWVFDGEGIPTRKIDGTCCLIKEGTLYKRREIKAGKPKPDNFIQADYDTTTKKTVGWVPVSPTDASDKWHREAYLADGALLDGAYELCGPKVQGNPERLGVHKLIAHNNTYQYDDTPRDFDGLSKWLLITDCEGVVFHHEDGRMAKIKKRDFGIKR